MKKRPIDSFYLYINQIFSHSTSLGVTLLITVIVALLWANSAWSESYFHLWETELTIGFPQYNLTETLHHWVNDFLMAYFFFLVGLEVKREIIDGSLSSIGKAIVPVFGALGGMLVPALIYLSINWDGDGKNGWGIPMATDIAFAIGFLALAGSRIKNVGKTFLTALAAADDIGAILIIAFFLSTSIDLGNLTAAGIYFLIMLSGNFLGLRNVWFYLVVGVFGLWVALLLSGVHATLAGILAAFCIPARTKITEQTYLDSLKNKMKKFEDTCFTPSKLLTEQQVDLVREVIKDSKRVLPPLQRIESNLKPVVNYVILPLFAFANSGIKIDGNFLTTLSHPISLGIIFGLVIGKLLGIMGSIFGVVKSGMGRLPNTILWSDLAGLSLMGGVGFTMSLFIANLAFNDDTLLSIAKVGILCGSLISALLGIVWLRRRNEKLKKD